MARRWAARTIRLYLDPPGTTTTKAHFLEQIHPLCPQLGNDPGDMRYAVDDWATRLLIIDSSHAGTSKQLRRPMRLSAGWRPRPGEGGYEPATVLRHHSAAAAGNAMD